MWEDKVFTHVDKFKLDSKSKKKLVFTYVKTKRKSKAKRNFTFNDGDILILKKASSIIEANNILNDIFLAKNYRFPFQCYEIYRRRKTPTGFKKKRLGYCFVPNKVNNFFGSGQSILKEEFTPNIMTYYSDKITIQVSYKYGMIIFIRQKNNLYVFFSSPSSISHTLYRAKHLGKLIR